MSVKKMLHRKELVELRPRRVECSAWRGGTIPSRNAVCQTLDSLRGRSWCKPWPERLMGVGSRASIVSVE